MGTDNNGKAWLESFVQAQRSALNGRMPSYPYLCNEDFVLRHGQEFQPAPSPEDFERKEMGKCFENAFQLVISNENVRYVEGYARDSETISLHHGWCIDASDKVLDPTWKDGVWYLGVVFDRQYVFDVFEARKEYGVLDAWELRFPLITGRHRYLGHGKVEYDSPILLG